MVTIRGNVNYERVPPGIPGTGLNYAGQVLITLDAEVLVEALDATTQNVVASGRFASGFELTVPGQTNIALRATAEMSRQAPQPLPHWRIPVRDLDANGVPLGPVYSYTGAAFNSGTGGMHDLQIPSGWSSTGALIGPRHAAPFAILDSVARGLALVLSVAPAADFPSLTIDWGPNNTGGQTFFDPDARVIVLSGEVNVDTDEYDAHVIVHELGHFIDDSFSRDDSFGGPHGFGDRLDMRLAFSEGFATAFAAMALGDSRYRDSFGSGQGNEGFFDIENDTTLNEGWYSEFSTQEILWDLFDNLNDGGDSVGLGFQPLWDVLQGAKRQTEAMTSIFPVVTALKELQPAEATAIATLLANEQIVGATIDAHGSTETNDAGSSHVLPVYTSIMVGGSVQLRSTNEFGTPNKLSGHRFLRLSLTAPATVRITASAASGRDPDVLVFRRGESLGPDQGPSDENFLLDLEAGDYVLDVFDCGNVGCNPGVAPAPIDITVAVMPN